MNYSLKYDEIKHIVVENESGMRVELSAFGASIYDIEIKNENGIYESMVLKATKLEDFYLNPSYYGKTIGRWAGRIDKAVCQINEKTYNLEINWHNVNSLHGGFDGLSSRVFDYNVVAGDEYVDVEFLLEATDNVLPGLAKYKITYRVYNNENTILLLLNASCDEDTLMNLTNHAYFNLSGNSKRTILNHKLYLQCDKYTRLNNELITLSIDKVNQIFDFTTKREIGLYIEDESLQNHTSRGYDHCFIKADESNELLAILEEEENNTQLCIYSSYPSVVFYSGCYPDSFKVNKEVVTNVKYHSLCLEPQFIPNGINMDSVNKAILRKGEEYNHYIRYEFKKIR